MTTQTDTKLTAVNDWLAMQGEKLSTVGIPVHMHGGLARYIVLGIPPGDFLSLILCNDYYNAAGHADEDNIVALHKYARFIYNYVPLGCHGSRDNFNRWVSTGGIYGQQSEKELANGS